MTQRNSEMQARLTRLGLTAESTLEGVELEAGVVLMEPRARGRWRVHLQGVHRQGDLAGWNGKVLDVSEVDVFAEEIRRMTWDE